jgi:hypothetical protein
MEFENINMPKGNAHTLTHNKSIVTSGNEGSAPSSSNKNESKIMLPIEAIKKSDGETARHKMSSSTN